MVSFAKKKEEEERGGTSERNKERKKQLQREVTMYNYVILCLLLIGV